MFEGNPRKQGIAIDWSPEGERLEIMMEGSEPLDLDTVAHDRESRTLTAVLCDQRGEGKVVLTDVQEWQDEDDVATMADSNRDDGHEQGVEETAGEWQAHLQRILDNTRTAHEDSGHSGLFRWCTHPLCESVRSAIAAEAGSAATW